MLLAKGNNPHNTTSFHDNMLPAKGKHSPKKSIQPEKGREGMISETLKNSIKDQVGISQLTRKYPLVNVLF
jgi:hypothetical protein